MYNRCQSPVAPGKLRKHAFSSIFASWHHHKTDSKGDPMKLHVQPYTVEVTQKNIRSVRLRITSAGELKMSIPQHVSIDEAERFVIAHRSWIEQKRAELQNSPLAKNDGVPLLFGQPYQTEIRLCEQENAFFSDGVMTLYTNDPSDKTKIEALSNQCILRIMQERANVYLRHYAKVLGVKTPSYRFRKMKSRWGSYSLKTGRISLNFLLVNLDERCLAYVTAHELCHIFYPNHGSGFHALLDRIMPDNREIARLFR